MKLVIQRVSSASVTVGTEVVGGISAGLFVLLGIKKGDTFADADILVDKLSKLRILSDHTRKMNLSLKDTNLEVLLVSQFTLYANTKDGNRPSFLEAEDPVLAKKLYGYFTDKLIGSLPAGHKVATGSFGEYMKIKADLDGPVTITLES